MFEDEDLPRFKPVKLVPKKLDGLSREDLNEYLAFLESERGRAEAVLGSKSGMSAEAEALFRK